jgi:hypothetical protein
MLRKFVVIVTLFSISSCAAPPLQNSPVRTSTSAPQPIAPLSPLVTPTAPLEHGALVQHAIVDLARRLGVEPALVQLESITSDEFPGGDLGCPSPDRPALPQPAMISGQRIVLRVGNVNHEYRAAGMQLLYCEPR